MKQATVMPKPRMTLQIGITGHRSNKIKPESRPAVEQTLRMLYAMIGEAIAKIALETQDRIHSAVAPLIRIVSGLAEGADRIAVTVAPANWRLEAVLPMPRSEYARDFLGTATASDSNAEFERLLARAASVIELPLLPAVDVRDDAGRAQHYRALGAFLVRRIDLLVAVWDGQQADGPGGTATVVARHQRRTAGAVDQPQTCRDAAASPCFGRHGQQRSSMADLGHRPRRAPVA